MKVFITGATGFVGRAVIRELLRRNHIPIALTRPGSENKLQRSLQGESSIENLRIVSGDVLKPETWMRELKEVDAVIHLVGIIREFGRARFDRLHREATQRIVHESELAGARRYVHMSACGVGRLSKSVYMKTKLAGEKIVRASRMNWTIFRPSLIFGSGDGLVTPFVKQFRTLPVAPLISGGKTVFQPIAVEDVAKIFVNAVEREDLKGRTFEIGGPEAFSFRQIIDEIGAALGKKIIKISIPSSLLVIPAILLQRFRFFPFGRDQLRMLKSDNRCDDSECKETFDIKQVSLQEGIRAVVDS